MLILLGLLSALVLLCVAAFVGAAMIGWFILKLMAVGLVCLGALVGYALFGTPEADILGGVAAVVMAVVLSARSTKP